MIRVTATGDRAKALRRDIEAHSVARRRRMAWRALWRDLRGWLPRFDWRTP